MSACHSCGIRNGHVRWESSKLCDHLRMEQREMHHIGATLSNVQNNL